MGDSERTLSVGAVFDLEPEEEAAERLLRDLWRSAEGSLDVRLHFDARLAVDGVLPAIDVKQLRRELLSKLRLGFELDHRAEMKGQLGLHTEIDEQEELASIRTSAALFSHSAARQPPELAVLLCAAVVYHFPARRAGALGATPRAVAEFQKAVIETVRDAHPALWRSLCSVSELSDRDAADVLQRLGEVLLTHRHDFWLTRHEY